VYRKVNEGEGRGVAMEEVGNGKEEGGFYKGDVGGERGFKEGVGGGRGEGVVWEGGCGGGGRGGVWGRVDRLEA